MRISDWSSDVCSSDRPDGAVVYGGDNRTGDGAGDDETIKVDFAKLGADVKKVVVAVTIHEGVERRQNFGSVSNAYARVLDDADGKELARFDLSEDGSANTSLIFVELYRGPQGDIKVKAIGEGWASGLSGLARSEEHTSELQSLMRMSYA